tara:strand:+ start:337 stop:600 length:264 start_codon:yes stop_codon:yes gene_type:complete
MQKESNIKKLKEKGVLSAAATKSLEKSGGISKRKMAPIRFFKTNDNKEVFPRLYMRGAKGTEPSKKMVEFLSEFDKLVNKYANTKKQ